MTALETPALDWRVTLVSHLPSTQDAIRARATDGAGEGEVVQALVQTKGRGRQGREWVSPMGNLYMSALLRPNCPARVAGQISFIVALALSAAIDEFIEPPHVKTLKWPNDVLIDGRKCAGILLESILGKDGGVEALIVGIGVNILAPPEDRIGLQNVSARQVAIHPFRDRLLVHLGALYRRWQVEGFAFIRQAWMEQAHGIGAPITARLAEQTIEGVFEGLNKDGALMLILPSGEKIDISAGDVYFAAGAMTET